MKKGLLFSFLICLLLIQGCSSGGGSDTSNIPTPASLTLAERIEKVQIEASAKGCTVVDTSANYSLLTGGENSQDSNSSAGSIVLRLNPLFLTKTKPPDSSYKLEHLS